MTTNAALIARIAASALVPLAVVSTAAAAVPAPRLAAAASSPARDEVFGYAGLLPIPAAEGRAARVLAGNGRGDLFVAESDGNVPESVSTVLHLYRGRPVGRWSAGSAPLSIFSMSATPTGDVYLVSSSLATGSFLRKFTAVGRLLWVRAVQPTSYVAATPDGGVFLAQASSLQRFSPLGAVVASTDGGAWPVTTGPSGALFQVWDSRVAEFDAWLRNGRWFARFPDLDAGPGGSQGYAGLAFDPGGAFAVGDQRKSYVWRFSRSGLLRGYCSSPLPGRGSKRNDFFYVASITTVARDTVVADPANGLRVFGPRAWPRWACGENLAPARLGGARAKRAGAPRGVLRIRLTTVLSARARLCVALADSRTNRTLRRWRLRARQGETTTVLAVRAARSVRPRLRVAVGCRGVPRRVPVG